MTINSDEQIRYRRQILIPQIGPEGQERLKASSVLIVGAGGLGSPASLYLAAAGIGRLGLLDSDCVELSNLNRQVLFTGEDIGLGKARQAAARLSRLNPGINIEVHETRLTTENAASLLQSYNLVVDATDNMATRMLMNRTAQALGIPLVYAGVMSFCGQLMTVMPGRGPCLACLFGHQKNACQEGALPGNQPVPVNPEVRREIPVLGALPGIIGAMEAVEALKALLGIGDLLVGRLLIFDGLAMIWDEVQVLADPECPVCARKLGNPAHGRP